MTEGALVLFSGGQDSATCLAFPAKAENTASNGTLQPWLPAFAGTTTMSNADPL